MLNAEMLKRVPNRAASRALWRIGHPYHPEPVHALEIRQSGGGGGGFPPFAGSRDPWTHHSLSLAIGHAVLEALQDAELVEQRSHIHAGERAGGYVRLFLERASAVDSALFTQALAEALGPLRRPRYVIPRMAERAGRCWGLCRRRYLLSLNVHVRIPALEDGAQLPVERSHSRL
jgi:hypothetical protein